MAQVKVTLDGVPELKAKLAKLDSMAKGALLADAVDAGLDVMLSAVDRYTPIGETGQLKRGNKKQIWKQSAGYVEGEVLNSAPHAHLVEFGHGGPKPAGPHPFLRPGFDTSRDGAERALTNVVKQGLESV